MKAAPLLSTKAIQEFKTIYHEEFGKDISDEEAQRMGLNVLRVFKVLLEPSQSVSLPEQQAD